MTSAQIINVLPRYFLEIFAFGGMLLLVLYLIFKDSNFMNSVPIIALFAFAGYRILPALQQVYGALTRMRFITSSLDALYEDYKFLNYRQTKKELNTFSNNILSLKNSIILKNVRVIYPNSSESTLKDINLRIDANTSVAFVGETGSGKTTILDIILGLLEIKDGSLEVDGNKIDKTNLRSWQHLIGYVPQQIYLTDSTVESNIALGINADEINYKSLEHAAKIANIHNFIVNDLPFNTKLMSVSVV